MRLFVAIPLPADIRRRIRQTSIKLQGTPVKLVEEENIHITLKFIGEVSDNRVKDIMEALSTVTFAPFQVSLGGVSAFPSPSAPRVIWIGIEEGQDRIKALANQIECALLPMGVKKEKRPFHPHVTIGRVKRYTTDIEQFLGETKEAHFGSFVIREFVLYQSVLRPEGPKYISLLRVSTKDLK